MVITFYINENYIQNISKNTLHFVEDLKNHPLLVVHKPLLYYYYTMNNNTYK